MAVVRATAASWNPGRVETEWWWHNNGCLENKIVCVSVHLVSEDYVQMSWRSATVWWTEKRVEHDAEQQSLRQKPTYEWSEPALALMCQRSNPWQCRKNCVSLVGGDPIYDPLNDSLGATGWSGNWAICCCTSRNVAMVLPPHIVTHINLKISLGDCTMEPALNASFSEVHVNVSGEERCNSSVQKTEISSFIPPEWFPVASLNWNNAPLEADIQYKRKKKPRSAHVIRISARLSHEDYAENCN